MVNGDGAATLSREIKIGLNFPSRQKSVRERCYKRHLLLKYRTYLLYEFKDSFWGLVTSGQSYKASTLVNYDTRVISISNLLVITTLES